MEQEVKAQSTAKIIDSNEPVTRLSLKSGDCLLMAGLAPSPAKPKTAKATSSTSVSGEIKSPETLQLRANP